MIIELAQHGEDNGQVFRDRRRIDDGQRIGAIRLGIVGVVEDGVITVLTVTVDISIITLPAVKLIITSAAIARELGL